MDFEEYRTLFAIATFSLVLVATAPIFSMFVFIPSSTERFSELWILGSTHMAGDYPVNVRVNETYHVFVGVSNHIGCSTYYMLYVKFRNQTQPPPDKSAPSPLPPLYELHAFVADNDTWEAPLNFTFLEVSRLEDSYFMGRMSINDVVFSVNCPARWDSENGGFYYQLFLELYRYDASLHGFQYDNLFVGIWLNATD